MFNSNIIDVAIGLVFVYLTLSLICSSAREGIETFLKRRASDLEKGIRELLGVPPGAGTYNPQPNGIAPSPTPEPRAPGANPGEPAADNTAAEFMKLLYNHGLINALYRGKYGETPLKKLPSYIPSANFALAVLDLRKAGKSLPKNLQNALGAFDMKAKGDVIVLQRELEGWFNSSMDRVSGWYKRRTQVIVAVLGLAAAIAVNADTIYISRRLSTDSNLRQSVARIAEEHAHPHKDQTTTGGADTNAKPVDSTSKEPSDSTSQPSENSSATEAQAVAQIRSNLETLDGVGLPIGWEDFAQTFWKAKGKAPKDATFSDYFDFGIEAAKLHCIGWIITALAVSLGAPFWFDMLNRIMVVRSTVKPSEKSGDEASKDPKPAASPDKGNTAGDGQGGGQAPAAAKI